MYKKRYLSLILGDSKVHNVKILRHALSSEYCGQLLRDRATSKFCLPEIRHLMKFMKQNQRQE